MVFALNILGQRSKNLSFLVSTIISFENVRKKKIPCRNFLIPLSSMEGFDKTIISSNHLCLTYKYPSCFTWANIVDTESLGVKLFILGINVCTEKEVNLTYFDICHATGTDHNEI